MELERLERKSLFQVAMLSTPCFLDKGPVLGGLEVDFKPMARIPSTTGSPPFPARRAACSQPKEYGGNEEMEAGDPQTFHRHRRRTCSPSTSEVYRIRESFRGTRNPRLGMHLINPINTSSQTYNLDGSSLLVWEKSSAPHMSACSVRSNVSGYEPILLHRTPSQS